MWFVEKKGSKKFSTVENFDFVESFYSPFFDNPRRYAIHSRGGTFAFPQFRCARVETGQLWKTRWKQWKTGRLHRRKMKKRACRSRMDRQARRVLVRVLRYSALKVRNAAIAASFVAVASSSVLCAV